METNYNQLKQQISSGSIDYDSLIDVFRNIQTHAIMFDYGELLLFGLLNPDHLSKMIILRFYKAHNKPYGPTMKRVLDERELNYSFEFIYKTISEYEIFNEKKS